MRWLSRAGHRRATATIALCALLGLGLRLALLARAGWRYDYDEGMVGLQALSIVRGARPVFHPGQPYLGALESYLIAPVFVAFGADAVTLKLIPWLLSGVYVATTGWLGLRAYGARTGALAALLAAYAPSYLLITGMKAWGATAETLVLGNLALIAASYVADSGASSRTARRALVLFGLVSGIACWVSWLFAFYAIPIAFVMLWRGRSLPVWAWGAAALAFAVGSLPFWAENARSGFATFSYLLAEQGEGLATPHLVFDHLIHDLAPRLVSADPRWPILSWPAIWWLQAAYQGGALALVMWGWRGGWDPARRPARVLLALFVVNAPALYLLSGWGNHAINRFGHDATGRYLLMLHSAFPIGVAALAVMVARRRAWLRPVGAGIVAATIGLNLLGALRADPLRSFASPYYLRQPATLDSLIAFLAAQDIAHVWTDVGIAHVLMFETEGRIQAADWYDIYAGRGLLRFPAVPERIARAERVAFVEAVVPGQHDTPLERAFEALSVPYVSARPSPDLLVVVPLGPVEPAALGDGLGYQF